MSQRIFQVDAFTQDPFAGNPAGVCLLEAPHSEDWMQRVAAEMNLSETAFVRRRSDGDYDLQWFTPAVEVDLCGHATLATTHILRQTGALSDGETARFHSKSGLLTARAAGARIELDFPATPPVESELPDGLLEALGIDSAAWVGRPRFDYLVELDSDRAVRELTPAFLELHGLGVRGVIVTAPSAEPDFDFISRFFAPGAGINEDPVTGSAHCALAPYWAAKLGKTSLVGYQASERGGIVEMTLAENRVRLRGSAVTVLEGTLLV